MLFRSRRETPAHARTGRLAHRRKHPVILHAMDTLAAQGYEPQQVMLLQATSPVRRPGTIDRAIEQMTSTGVDSLVGVVPQTPFLW